MVPPPAGELPNLVSAGLPRSIRAGPTTKRPSVGDAVFEIAPIHEHPGHEQHSAGDHRDDAIVPAVAPHDCRGHAQHTDADERLAAHTALGALAAPPLPFEGELLG